ncbi:hypothetical protein KFL_009280040 [Klebsormidium nitens]|uniref:Uncharacterized protein n=1 Tax=Klebsormidium nitens TaxID=105231 RepID=A0A1Y1IV47_KLENI|nr:hypothetical protein KFL_009280040 [Klebsormidium nitens]|eukprot:GAQ92128.1 hypothetical protein KFL_009280040 [Klebsormidium nitens]
MPRCCLNLENTLRVIDRTSGDVLNEYRGHVNKSYKVGNCFSNDDAHVLSGSEDGQVFAWTWWKKTREPPSKHMR